MEWAFTCEQLQMLQCQHAWPQAILCAVMEREMDWTMHDLAMTVVVFLLLVCVCVCVRHSVGVPCFAALFFVGSAIIVL